MGVTVSIYFESAFPRASNSPDWDRRKVVCSGSSPADAQTPSPAARSDDLSSQNQQTSASAYHTFPAAYGLRPQHLQLWPSSAPFFPDNLLGLERGPYQPTLQQQQLPQARRSSMPRNHRPSRASDPSLPQSSSGAGSARDAAGPSPSDFPQNTQAPYPANFNNGYSVDHAPAFFSPAYRPPFAGPSSAPANSISPEVNVAPQFSWPASVFSAASDNANRQRAGAADYYAPPTIEGVAPYPLAEYPTTGTRQWGSFRQMPSGIGSSVLPFAPQFSEAANNSTGSSRGGGPISESRPQAGSRRSTNSKPEPTDAISESDPSRPNTADNIDRKPILRPKRESMKKGHGRKDSIPEVDGEDELEDDEENKVDHRKRKRNRTIRSCVPCHNHKRKCDRKRPCSRCTALGLTGSCVYEVDEIRNPNDPEEAENDRLLRRIAELEKVVRELRQGRTSRNAPAESPPRGSSPAQYHSGSGDSDAGGSTTKRRRVIVDRFARIKIDEAQMAELQANSQRDVDDHGGDGTRRSSGETGASDVDSSLPDRTRRRASGTMEIYAPDMLPGEELVVNRHGRRAFLGPSAGQSHLRRLRELLSNTSKTQDGAKDLFSFPEDWAFTGWLPDMRKTFPFTTIWSHENFSGEIISLLPNKAQSSILLEAWKTEFAPLFNAWHQPTVEADFNRFFQMTSESKRNLPLCSLSLYLMICSLGCLVRASRAEMFGDDSVDRDASHTGEGADLTSSRLQSELYLSGAFHALRLSSFLSNPTLTGVQAQILLCVYLLVSERVPDCWCQTGTLVRQVIAMGLHVDPLSLDPRLSMREAEVRRRIWWSVAGLDALLCVSFGRPSCINYYTTNLPQDRSDADLSDSPGSAQDLLPPSTALRNETTDMTFHAAYFQITIPSYELLDRVFRTDWQYSRSAIYGWFCRSPPEGGSNLDDKERLNTYQGAVRLAKDIFEWYAALPRGMRFDPDKDTAEDYLRTKSSITINQIFTLCLKTAMLVLVLHRPYLRADPEAYPESTEVCFQAARLLLAAYTCASQCKASICWSFFTVSFRAFHAGAVMAFLAIRKPGTERAKECLAKLRGAIAIFEERLASWKISHPMQADMCAGLVRLDRLATLATQQRSSTAQQHPTGVASLRVHRHKDPEASPSSSRSATPLSQIRAFPSSSPSNTTNFGHSPSALQYTIVHNEVPAAMASDAPVPTLGGLVSTATPQPHPTNHSQNLTAPTPGSEMNNLKVPAPDGIGIDIGSISNIGTASQYGVASEVEAIGFRGDGVSAESLTLPEMWASMFGIKMDGEGASGGQMSDQSSHLGAPRWA